MKSCSETTLCTRVLRSADDFRDIAPEWRELFPRCPDATPFQHPAWLFCWMDAFAPREVLGIEVREASRLIGFASLLVYARAGERVLAFAGGGFRIISASSQNPAVNRR